MITKLLDHYRPITPIAVQAYFYARLFQLKQDRVHYSDNLPIKYYL